MVSRASDAVTEHVGTVMNGAVDIAKRAQDAGLTNWWGWYLIGVVDSTVDLVTDAVSDVYSWGTDARDGIKPFISGLRDDLN